jgi:basic membrane lipoprotein Med (substrate-binding protein (PBP1-ABC) superfamily)
MEELMKKLITSLLISCMTISVFAGGNPENSDSDKIESIAVFIPGVVAGSPTYEMMVRGVERAGSEGSVQVQVIEGGFDQGTWKDQLMDLAATGSYDLIVSSNPAIPALAAEVSENFPAVKFLLLDGSLEGNPAIYTLRYNQTQQAQLAGYFAGLLSLSSMEGMNAEKKIGLIAGQEYPDMMKSIMPGFLAGAQDVDPEFELDFRIVGNWYDAGLGAELASAMIQSGVDVILPIAGGAGQGVIQSSREAGTKVLWYDTAGYDLAPGIILGSTSIDQERAAYEKTVMAIDGTLPFGSAELVGIKEGYVSFVDSGENFLPFVPMDLVEKIRDYQEKLKDN